MDNVFHLAQTQAFRLVGYHVETTNQKRQGVTDIANFWKDFFQNKQAELMPMMNKEPFGLMGVSIYNTDEKDARKFTYMIAVSSEQEVKEDMICFEVPALQWAVFPCTMDTIGKTESMAITKWLPKAGYKPLNKGYLTGRMKSNAPDIEHYGEHGEVEVWVAVEKK